MTTSTSNSNEDEIKHFLSLQTKYNEMQKHYDDNYQNMPSESQLYGIGELLTINKRLQNMITQNQSTNMDFLNSRSTQQQTQLMIDNAKLETQKREIKQKVQEYNSISLSDNNSRSTANQNLFHFRVLLICLILLIYLYFEIISGRKNLLNGTTWLLILSFSLYFLDIQLISFIVLIFTILRYITITSF
jgi:hypothetical protein